MLNITDTGAGRDASSTYQRLKYHFCPGEASDERDRGTANRAGGTQSGFDFWERRLGRGKVGRAWPGGTKAVKSGRAREVLSSVDHF